MRIPSPSNLPHAEFNSITKVSQDFTTSVVIHCTGGSWRLKFTIPAPEGAFLPVCSLTSYTVWEDANTSSLTNAYKLLSSLHGATEQRPMEVYTQTTPLSYLQLWDRTWDKSALHCPPLVQSQCSDDNDQKMHPTFQVQHSREWFWLSCSKQGTD